MILNRFNKSKARSLIYFSFLRSPRRLLGDFQGTPPYSLALLFIICVSSGSLFYFFDDNSLTGKGTILSEMAAARSLLLTPSTAMRLGLSAVARSSNSERESMRRLSSTPTAEVCADVNATWCRSANRTARLRRVLRERQELGGN